MKLPQLLLALFLASPLFAAPELITSSEVANRALGVSGGAEISRDGRFVFFQSTAPNLAKPIANGDFINIFRRNLQSAETLLVTQNATGNAGANAQCTDFMFSGDSDTVVFSSRANNLVSDDADTYSDVFLRVISSNLTIRLSAPQPSVTGLRRHSSSATISDDGQRIAFQSYATDLGQAPLGSAVRLFYVHDRTNGVTRQINSRPLVNAGTTSYVSNPFLTRNGQKVVFEFNGPNLITGGTTYGTNVYVYELGIDTNQSVTFVSTNAMTVLGKPQTTRAHSMLRGVSADGSVVAFLTDIPPTSGSNSTNYLFRHELLTGLTEVIATNIVRTRDASAVFSEVALSADGRFLTFGVGGNIYRWDELNHTRDLVTVTLGNVPVTGTNVSTPVMTADGRFVLFASPATNLVSPDAPVFPQLYRRDMDSGTTIRVSSNINTNAVDAQILDGSISDDGKSIVFTSNLAAFTGAGDDRLDCLLWTEATSLQVSLVSAASSQVPARVPFRFLTLSTQPMSADGSRVVFSAQKDFGPGLPQIWLRDRTQASPTLISSNSAGAPGDGISQNAMISADGRWIALQSTASNLDSSITQGNAGFDVFLYDAQTASTRVITKVATASSTPQIASELRGLSPDGKYLVIASSALNFTDPPLTATGSLGDPIYYLVNATNGGFVSIAVDVNGTAIRARHGDVRFSSDGRYLAAIVLGPASYVDARGGNATNAPTGPSTITLLLRDLTTGVTRGYPANINAVGTIEFSSDSSYLVTTALAGPSGKAITRINLQTSVETQTDFGATRVQELALSRNAQRIAVRTHSGTVDAPTVRFLDFDVPSNLQISQTTDGSNHRQVISSDGQFTFFSSAYADSTRTNATPAIYSYDANSQALTPFASGDAATVSPYISADGSTLLVASAASDLGSDIDANNAIDLYAYTIKSASPKLTVTLNGNQVVLHWPVSVSNYVLEYSPTIDATAVWTVYPDLPGSQNNEWIIALDPRDAAFFFRLRK